jgi:1,4-alpha-glucan branching enzyme
LQTNQQPYQWQNTSFQRPANEDLVIYELLVRDFVGTHSYKTLSDTLTYLKKLGVNAIELMPIMEFSGNESWGYNPIYYFAPDKYYGTKNDLKAFIDKAHQMGMAVILDMVLNQADYEFPYVKAYWDGSKPAANSPYFNQQATHPFSVFFDFNHESAATRVWLTQ